MSSAEILDPPSAVPKPSAGGNHNGKHPAKFGNTNNSKRKNKHERTSRKRSKSFTGCGLLIQPKPVLPSKFLLGGNIKDPLNLNSLQDEEINRAMNAVTPKSSPVPTPPRKKAQLDVIIPKNIHDPLNLTDCRNEEECEQVLRSPIKKVKKKRLKKRRTMSATFADTFDTPDTIVEPEAKTPELSTDSAKVPDVPDNAEKSSVVSRNLSIDLSITPKKEKPPKRKSEEYVPPMKKFKNAMDKIVSPVVPQPGAWLKRSNSVTKWTTQRPNKNPPGGELKMPQFKEKDKRYQYGNYNRYYGYRNPHNEVDHRLRVFSHHAYLFENKDILDIGCNIGHITLCVARDFRARTVTGIDIDPKLISIARKNVKHYVKTDESPPHLEDLAVERSGLNKNNVKSSEFFPISMPIIYGAIDVPGFHDASDKGKGFPNNVTFKQCNYILEDDNLIALEQPQFDVILCLSITKWIHLNWGDAGIKQAFRRMYAQLRPGGRLILEPQYFGSYKNKKKLTETIYKNYNSIEFFPEKFREYLLSPMVGFAKSEILGYPQHQARGFRRPLLIFTKSTMFPSERIEATPIGSTPHVSSSFGSELNKTDKYEGRTHSECIIQHVYTDLLDTRYCGCEDDNVEINHRIGEELKDATELENDGPSSVSPVLKDAEFEDDEYGGSERTDTDNINSEEFRDSSRCVVQNSVSDNQENTRTDGVNSVGDNT